MGTSLSFLGNTGRDTIPDVIELDSKLIPLTHRDLIAVILEELHHLRYPKLNGCRYCRRDEQSERTLDNLLRI